MVKRMIALLILSCFVISFTSCATIISGRTQNVPVITIPGGAIATVAGMKQITPATFILDRRMDVYQVKIEKEGYKSVEITLKKGINVWAFGNIIGIVGIIVDIANGSASKFVPDTVEVDLIKQELGLNTLEDKDILIVRLKGE